MTVQSGPGSVCEEFVGLVGVCLEEHAAEIEANMTQGDG